MITREKKVIRLERGLNRVRNKDEKIQRNFFETNLKRKRRTFCNMKIYREHENGIIMTLLLFR